MVSATTIILLGGLALFVFAGGVGVSRSAFAQAKSDFSKIRSGVQDNELVVNTIDRFVMQTKNNPKDKAGEMIF